MAVQSDWRFCHKCAELFFDGFPSKGICPTGGGHEPAGFTFVLPHGVPESPVAQRAWRFCHKCNSIFFDGFPHKGACPRGGGHEAAGFEFVLPHDVPDSPTAQSAWRFCHKCNSMFFDGFPQKGACPTGGGHEAAGFNFVLPHLDPATIELDTGPITSDLPLGGSIHLLLRQNGDFTFRSHAHNSGFTNIDYGISAVLMTTTGIAFTCQHAGHVEGTIGGLPFDAPDRNDDFVQGGHNPVIANEWNNIRGGTLTANLSGQDTLVLAVEGLINKAIEQLGAAAAKAVIGLVF